ncbi:hypothetical protein ACTFIR_003763 [Dictyostelium discoideum]
MKEIEDEVSDGEEEILGLSKKSKKELQEILKSKKLITSGNKPDLIDRIITNGENDENGWTNGSTSSEEKFYPVAISDYRNNMGYVDRNNKMDSNIFIFSQIQKMVDYLLKLSVISLQVIRLDRGRSNVNEVKIIKKLSISCFIIPSQKNANVVQYVNFKPGTNAKHVSYTFILVAHMIFTKISKPN